MSFSWIATLKEYNITMVAVTKAANTRRGVSGRLSLVHRKQTRTILKNLLGRDPTSDEITEVAMF